MSTLFNQNTDFVINFQSHSEIPMTYLASSISFFSDFIISLTIACTLFWCIIRLTPSRAFCLASPVTNFDHIAHLPSTAAIMCSLLAVRSYISIGAYFKPLFSSLHPCTDTTKPHILAMKGYMADKQTMQEELDMNSIYVSNATPPVSLLFWSI